MQIKSDDYDSPWKEILEEYLEDFMRFFFPLAARELDWGKGYTFLDKELQQVARDAELGKRFADKLVQLWRTNGDEAWVLIHIEIQGQMESGFARRMYTYNYRIFDRYNRPVASLAVLADDRPGWKPDRYSYELLGCEAGIKFPIVKLLDYAKKFEELTESENPFAVIVMVHIKTKETLHDDKGRKRWKLYLVRRLYERGYSRIDLINLFRFIDWLMKLPQDMEEGFWEEIRQYEEERNMPYVTSVERIGIKKGIQQGIQQGRREGILEAIELGLTIKFGAKGLRLLPVLRATKENDRLEMVKEAIKASNDLKEIEDLLQ